MRRTCKHYPSCSTAPDRRHAEVATSHQSTAMAHRCCLTPHNPTSDSLHTIQSGDCRCLWDFLHQWLGLTACTCLPAFAPTVACRRLMLTLPHQLGCSSRWSLWCWCCSTLRCQTGSAAVPWSAQPGTLHPWQQRTAYSTGAPQHLHHATLPAHQAAHQCSWVSCLSAAL